MVVCQTPAFIAKAVAITFKMHLNVSSIMRKRIVHLTRSQTPKSHFLLKLEILIIYET